MSLRGVTGKNSSKVSERLQFCDVPGGFFFYERRAGFVDPRLVVFKVLMCRRRCFVGRHLENGKLNEVLKAANYGRQIWDWRYGPRAIYAGKALKYFKSAPRVVTSPCRIAIRALR